MPDHSASEGAIDGPSRPPLVGRRFGHVRIDSLIDRGGMGEVYRGFDEALERRVAVKAIRPEQRPNEEARHRFHREARLLSKLEHANVCRIYDLYEGGAETGDLLILELVEGRKLGEVLQAGLKFEQKLRIAEQIASALAAAHHLRIIHRDLKPSNVMIKTSGRAKVLDFGLARSLDHPGDPSSSPSFRAFRESGDESALSGAADRLEAHTNHQFMVGTLAFMSPEQAVGERLTEASDLYSFGLLLQWLFTEVSPYGEDVSKLDLLRRVLQGDTIPFRTPDAHLTLLIEDLKRLNPERRPPAAECMERLQKIAGKPIRRRFRRTLASVVVLLTLLGSAVFWLNHQRVERREELTLAFTQQAKDIEWVMRIAHSLPLQELTLHQSDVRRRMGTMRGLMQIAGSLGRGPGNFALGRSHLALGEISRAGGYLQEAWEAQYRHSEVALALAMVRAEQLEDARAEGFLISDPDWRAHRDRWVDQTFRDRALEMLRAAKEPRGEPGPLVDGLIALFERRFDPAYKALAQLRDRSPWLYEADGWIAELEIDRAMSLLTDGDKPGALRAFERAGEAFERAASVGSSDPRLHLSSARLWNLMFWLGIDGTLDPTESSLDLEILFQRAMEACRLGLQVDPQFSSCHLERARSLSLQAMRWTDESQQLATLALAQQELPPLIDDETLPAARRWQSWAESTVADLSANDELGAIRAMNDAVQQAERSRRLDEDPAGLWLQVEALGNLAAQMARWGEDPGGVYAALENILKDAVRADRTFYAAYLALGRTYSAKARYELSRGLPTATTLSSARTVLARAQNLEPRNTTPGELLAHLDEIAPTTESGSTPDLTRP